MDRGSGSVFQRMSGGLYQRSWQVCHYIGSSEFRQVSVSEFPAWANKRISQFRYMYCLGRLQMAASVLYKREFNVRLSLSFYNQVFLYGVLFQLKTLYCISLHNHHVYTGVYILMNQKKQFGNFIRQNDNVILQSVQKHAMKHYATLVVYYTIPTYYLCQGCFMWCLVCYQDTFIFQLWECVANKSLNDMQEKFIILVYGDNYVTTR